MDGCCRAFYAPPRDSDNVSNSEFGDADGDSRNVPCDYTYLPLLFVEFSVRNKLRCQVMTISNKSPTEINAICAGFNIRESNPHICLIRSEHSTSECIMRSIKCIPPTCLLMWCTVHNSHLRYHPNYAHAMNLTWLDKSSRSVDI